MYKVKDALLDSLSKIEEEEVGLLLSGGSGSASVLFALLDLGKKVHAYTFHMEDVESTDLIKARELCEKMNVKFTSIPLPRDLDVIKKDLLYLINDVGCRLKTDVECVFPIKHTLPYVKQNVLTSGLGDDNFFGLSKHAQINYKQTAELMDEYREKAFNAYEVQMNLMRNIAKEKGIFLHSPYQSHKMVKVFKGTEWNEINKPKRKQWILDSYPELFSDMKCYHANYQKGDSGISDAFLPLLESDWNIRGYKRTDGIYNSIARGEITE